MMIRTAFALAASAALVLGACSGQESATPEPTSVPSVPSPTMSESRAPLAIAGDSLRGVKLTWPSGHTWVFDTRTTVTDPVVAHLDGSFATSLSVTQSNDRTLDEIIADQQAFYDQAGYDVEKDWFTEVTVPGADRAVEYHWGSESGDGTITTRLIEVADRIVTVESYQYIEDLELIEAQEIEGFFASVTVNAADMAPFA